MTLPGPDPVGGPVVVVTLREIYDAVVRLTGRVDVVIAQQTETSRDVQDHEQRIRGLERRQWPLPTASVLLALIAVAIGIIPYLA